MAVQFSCPECDKVLKSANPIAPGKKVKCPSCGTVFAPAPAKPAAKPALKKPSDDETIELSKTKPADAKKPTKPAPFEDDENPFQDDAAPPLKAKGGIQAKKPGPMLDDEGLDDDAPPPKPKGGLQAKKPPPKPPNDFGFDDEDEAPAPPPKGKKAGLPPLKKGRPRDEDEDEDEDEDDRPRKGKPTKSSAGLFILLGVLILVLGLGAVAAFVWPGFLKSDQPGSIKGPDGDKGKALTPEPDMWTCVPADSIAVMGVNAGTLRDSKVGGAAFAQFKKLAGLDELSKKSKDAAEIVNAVDKVLLVVLPPRGKSEEMLGVVFFTSAVDFGKVKEVFEAKDVPGKDFAESDKGKDKVLIAQIAPKLLVFSGMSPPLFESRLKELGKEEKIPPDAKSQIDKVKDALVWLVAPNSDTLKAGFAKSSTALPPDPNIKQAVDALKAASFELREEGKDVLLKARVECGSPKDAVGLQSAVDGMVKLIVPFLLDGMEKKGETPPEMMKTIRSVVSTFKTGAEGNEAWASLTITGENLRTLEAFALAYFAGGAGPPMILPAPER